MISLGPGSFDMPVEAAVPPGGIGQGALGLPGASPFDAVLGMLVDEIESAGLSIDLESFDEDGEPNDGDASSTDVFELVNPLAVAPVPATLPLVPTQVIALGETNPNGDAKGAELNAAITANIEPAIEQGISTEQRASNELPKAFDELMSKDSAPATDAPVDTAPVTKTNEPAVSDLAPGAQIEAANANAQPVENQRAKAQPSTRQPKADRVRAESPRIDETPMRPFTVTAVDRAYASGEGDTPRSFDQRRDIAQEIRPQTIGGQTATASFVVPAETAGLRLGSTPEMALAVDAPGAIDQAAEMHLPQQIVQSIRLQAIDGGGEAVLRLRPEYLGEVVIAVKVEQGAVIAALQADMPAVRQWAERNEAVLRQALAEQGLQLERLTVTEKATDAQLDQESDRHQSREEEPSRQHSRRRRQQPADATFEVTV